MAQKIQVTLKFSKAELTKIQQIRREQYPHLPSLDAVVHVLTLQGVKDIINMQHGKNIVKLLKGKKEKADVIMQKLTDKKFGADAIKKWLQ